MILQPTTRYCQYCGKELKTKQIDVFGGNTVAIPIPCDCEESVKALVDEHHKKQEAEETRKREKAESKYRAAGIRERFIGDYIGSEDTAILYGEAKSEGVYLYGDSGVGKTAIASEIAKRAVDDGLKVFFVNVPSLIRKINASYHRDSDYSVDDLVMRCVRCDLLVLDDLGQEKHTESSIGTIYDVINERDMDAKPMVITSNFKRSELGKELKRNGAPVERIKPILSRIGGLKSHEIKGRDHRLG